jgi:vancomycin resistance protein YoaR
MAKQKTNVQEDLIDLPEPEGQSDFIRMPRRMPRLARWGVWVVAIAVGVLVVAHVLYAGKALPGVSANGANISGLGREAAIAATEQHLSDYNVQLISLSYADTTTSLSAAKLGVAYNVPAAVDAALAYGHSGPWYRQLLQQMRSLAARPTNMSSYTFDDAKLASYLTQIDSSVNAPVANATLNFSGTSVTVTPSKAGKRLNRPALIMALENRLSYSSAEGIDVPVATLPPTLDTPALEAAQARASTYVSGPVTLKDGATTTTLTPSDLIAWIKADRSTPKSYENTGDIHDFYQIPGQVNISLNDTIVAAYVAKLAGTIDSTPQNAALSITDNKATIFQPSRAGRQLDQAATIVALTDAIAKEAADRTVTLAIKTIQPDVSEDNLNDLGIKELISEGETTFPGSIAARVNNIKLGAALYNGILIKPGETFSFNKYFINVDAAHGWAPGLAIIGDKIEPIYGGGICQVSSTMYRAALLAGLPINERTNHAYAIDWYAAPYGVPGVDATVYNPGVDLKFTNDTGSYILIQTVLNTKTSDLKFDFYGTKTKTGKIRGPFFDSGNNDVTKPSTTTFYRDILDLSGKVIATDPVTTHYKSSLDFTHVDGPVLD